jgi:hypothetical protein
VPPIAHAPKLMVETFQPVRPSSRYCMMSPVLLKMDDAYFINLAREIPASNGVKRKGDIADITHTLRGSRFACRLCFP